MINNNSRASTVFAFMNSYSEGMSGGDLRFIEIAKRLNEFDWTIFTSFLGEKACENRGLNSHFFVTTNEKQFKYVIYTYIKRVVKALMLIKKINTDQVGFLYSTSDFLPDVIPAFAIKMKNKNAKWVQLIFHQIPIRRFVPRFAQKISFIIIKRFVDLIVVDNSFLREELVKQGFDHEKIRLNPPGIDIEYIKGIKPSKDVSYDAVYLGRLHPSKGIFDLVKIWKLVCQKKSESILAIIGDGRQKFKNKLNKEIYRFNLENNIHLLGYLKDEKAISLLKSSKMFLFPSHEEGFGIAILQALACGIPVVAWDLPVYKEFISSGIIKVPKGNINKFVDETCRLLNDIEFYGNISKQISQASLEHDWDIIGIKEQQFIKDFLK